MKTWTTPERERDARDLFWPTFWATAPVMAWVAYESVRLWWVMS